MLTSWWQKKRRKSLSTKSEILSETQRRVTPCSDVPFLYYAGSRHLLESAVATAGRYRNLGARTLHTVKIVLKADNTIRLPSVQIWVSMKFSLTHPVLPGLKKAPDSSGQCEVWRLSRQARRKFVWYGKKKRKRKKRCYPQQTIGCPLQQTDDGKQRHMVDCGHLYTCRKRF